MFKIFIFSFLIIFSFTSCSNKKLVFVNNNITDENLKKEKYEEDTIYCEVDAYKKVPLENQPTYQSKSGTFEMRNTSSGDTYTGSYGSGGGFAAGLAAGAAARQQSNMNNLREKVFTLCMKNRGWSLLNENNQDIKQKNKTNSKQPIESVSVQKKQNAFPLLATKEYESKKFVMNNKYHCKIIGYIQQGKLFNLNPKIAPKDTHLMDRYIHLKELNGHKFLLDKEFGLFNYLHTIDNTTIYTNGKADFSILGDAHEKIIYFNISPLEKDYKENMTFLYQCFDTY